MCEILNQCCGRGSMKFWYRYGSGDPYRRLMDPDPDPALFVSDLQDINKFFFSSKFFCLLLFEGAVHLYHFSKIKTSYRSHKTVGINVFLTIFAW